MGIHKRFPFATTVTTNIWHISLVHIVVFWQSVLQYNSNDIFISLHHSLLTVLWRQSAIKPDWSTVGGSIRKKFGHLSSLFLCVSLNTNAKIATLPLSLLHHLLSPLLSLIRTHWYCTLHINIRLLTHMYSVSFLTCNHTALFSNDFFLFAPSTKSTNINAETPHSLSPARSGLLVESHLFTPPPQGTFHTLRSCVAACAAERESSVHLNAPLPTCLCLLVLAANYIL